MDPTLMNLWSPKSSYQPTFFIPEGLEVSYSQLQHQTESLITALREGGVQAGEPIAIVLPNSLEFLVAFLATTWARAVGAPLNPGYKVEEFRFYLEDAGARAVLVSPGDHPAREAARQLQIPIWECGLNAQGQVFVRLTSGDSPLTTHHSPLTTRPTADDV